MNQEASKQSIGVILAIIGSGLVLATVLILLFYAMKGSQKIIASTAASTILLETQPEAAISEQETETK